MAVEIQLHPPKDQLVAFGLGKLNPPEAAQVELHLEQCADCCETLLNLEDDTFAGLVRKCQTSAVSSPQSLATLDLGTGTPFDAGAPAELPPALRTHGRYEILELIGRGGMGDVYKAQHKVMNRLVALKVIKPRLVRNEAAVLRFRREVQAAASLHHRHIVTAHDAEQAGDLHFLVMEFVAGVNLDEVVRERGPLPVAEACRLIQQAAEGLQHAHERGMVHRDIKPHNLMLTREGDVKILDFGLAGFATEVAKEEVGTGSVESGVETAAALHQLTQMGTMMGTPDYIAPEQAGDAHSADIRADIYSLGCTLYTLLAGAAPFGEGSVKDKLQAHRDHAPPPFSNCRNDVPAEVEAIVRKMLAKNPAERFQTPAEVAVALTQAQAGFAKPLPAARGVGIRRSRQIALVLGGLAAMLAGVIVLLTSQGTLEIHSEVDDVDVVVSQGGKEIVLKDLATGSTVKRLGSGQWDIKLQDDRNDVQLDKRSFTLSRFGKVIVTARLVNEATLDLADSNRPSKFFTTLGDLQAIVRKTVTDAGLNVSRMNGTEVDNSGGSRGKVSLKVEISGEQERDGKVLAAFRDKFKSLSTPAGAFISSVDSEMRGNVQATNLPYTAEGREGLIRVELEKTGADKREPKFGTWSFVVRLEEWPLERDLASESYATWTPLFNGRDLTGWKMQPDKPGNWRVENGVLIGGKLDGGSEEENSFLVTQKSDFANFHLKLEAKLNPGAADAGVLFDFADGSWAEANIAFNPSKRDQYVGSLMVAGTKLNGVTWQAAPRELASPGQWFTFEVIAVGRQITTKVNGKIAATHTQRKKTTGPIRLQDHGPFTVAEFRKIEIIELDEQGKPLNQPTSPGAAPPLTIGMNDEFGMLFEGRLVAPAEMSRVLQAALKENPERVVAIDLPKKQWTVAAHVDQLEQIARIAGAKHITRPAWVENTQPHRDDQSIHETHGLQSQAGSIERLAPARKLEGHTGPVKDVAYSPNGKWIASASGWPKGDQTLRIRDGSTGQQIHRLAGHTDNVTCVAFSPDSRYVASGSADKDKSVRLWDVEKGREVRAFAGSAYVDDLEISGDGESIVALFAHELVVWNLQSGEERLRIALGETKSRAMALLSGQRALTGDDKGKIVIWDLKDGRRVGTFDSYPGFVDEFAVSPDGKTALVVGTGIGMLHWEIDTGRVLRRFPEATFAKDAGFSPDGRFAAVARIGSVQLFELETGKMWQAPDEFVGGSYGFWSVAFSPDGGSLLAGGGYGSNSADGKALQGDYALRLWKLPESSQSPRDNHASQSISEVKRFPGHRAPVRSVAFSPDGKLIASAGGYSSDDYTVRIWDRESGRGLHVLEEHKAAVMFVAFSPDGSRLLTGDLHRQQYLWNPATGEKVGEWIRREADPSQVSHLNEVVFSPDGARIYFVQVGKKPAICIANAASGELQSLFPLEQAARPSIDLTRDGLHLLVPCSDGTVLLMDAKNGKTLRTYAAPKMEGTYPVSAWVARQSPDGAKVAVGYTGSMIRIWDFESGGVLRDIPAPNMLTNQLAFLADSRRLAAGGAAHAPQPKSPVAFLFDTETGEELARAPATLKTVRAFALSPDQRHLLTDGGQNASKKGADASGDFDLRLWRLSEAVLPAPPMPDKINLLRELPGSKEWITAVAYPDNDRAVTVALDGVVRVWKNGGAELDSHQLPLGGLADISPDGKSILIASPHDEERQSTVALWDIEPWQERWRITFPVAIADGELGKLVPKHVVRARFAPQGRVVVQSNAKSGVAIVDAKSGEILSRFPEENSAMGAASVSPDGKRLFVRLAMRPRSGTFGRIYRIEDGAELAQIDSQEVVLDAVWSRDGAHIILSETTLNEGRIAVFEASTGKLIRRWIAEPKGIESLALGRGNLLVTGGMTRIAVWDWSTEELLAAVESPKQDGDARLAIALSPDGKRLISGGARWLTGEDRLPRIWQLPEIVWPK